MVYEVLDQFRATIESAGLEVPEHIEADGLLHRFSSNGRRGDKAGWYVLHSDGIPAGMFGDWRTGISQTWRADIGRPLSLQEEASHRATIAAIREARNLALEQGRGDAAAKAQVIWDVSTPAETFPYLTAKGAKPHGTRIYGARLVVPIYDEGGVIHSLQFIDEDGSKQFLPRGRIAGCFYLIGQHEGAAVLAVCEGFATGATIHEETGYPVAVAFNAGNLLAVAKTMREKFFSLPLLICGDNDRHTPGNPGLTKATEAARAVNARLAVPEFAPGEEGSDWNDWVREKHARRAA